MRRITHDKTLNYAELDIYDPFVCQKSHAFTLSPDPNDPKWEVVTYYSDPLIGDPTYMRKSQDGVSIRVDSKPDNSWFEDLKNLEF
jgi:hypothetical protein